MASSLDNREILRLSKRVTREMSKAPKPPEPSRDWESVLQGLKAGKAEPVAK